MKFTSDTKLNIGNYYDEGFVCFETEKQTSKNIHSCKEVAGDLSFEVKDYIAYGRTPDKTQLALEKFKKLQSELGLNEKIELVKHESGLDFLVLEDTWYNKNILTKEIGRILIKFLIHPRELIHCKDYKVYDSPFWEDPHWNN